LSYTPAGLAVKRVAYSGTGAVSHIIPFIKWHYLMIGDTTGGASAIYVTNGARIMNVMDGSGSEAYDAAAIAAVLGPNIDVHEFTGHGFGSFDANFNAHNFVMYGF
jgi:hypothetical protein